MPVPLATHSARRPSLACRAMPRVRAWRCSRTAHSVAPEGCSAYNGESTTMPAAFLTATAFGLIAIDSAATAAERRALSGQRPALVESTT